MFRKDDRGIPGSTALEATGLRWLADAMDDGGAAVVPVRSGRGWLEEPQLNDRRCTPKAAFSFGRALAHTHAAGASHWGAPPQGWEGDGWMGRARLPLRAEAWTDSWGEFFATDRIMPMLAPARDNGSIDRSGAVVIEKLCERLRDGDFNHSQPQLLSQAGKPVARLHGDLWSGNVLWCPVGDVARSCKEFLGEKTADEPQGGAAIIKGSAAIMTSVQRLEAFAGGPVVGVMIDPAAHGGHAETDLADLGLFGQQYLDSVYEGYQSVSPLESYWSERVGLHRVHMLIVHAMLFGGGYGYETVQVARHYV